jgi:O-methyltransferase involved in polyketide biosynthesis
MTKIQDVTGTAFIVAEYRARENGAPDPLYRDPIVPLFLNDRTRQAADRMAADFPTGEKGVRFLRATMTITSMSNYFAAVGRSSFLALGSTPGRFASSRRALPISKSMRQI